MAVITRASHCKVNLILNILGKRPDGFHEVETVFLPVPICDTVEVARAGTGIAMTCSDPTLPTDGANLVMRAAAAFLLEAGIRDGLRIHLVKNLPVAAGLGGGSGNAAQTLLALNELFPAALNAGELQRIAAALGADVPFFLQRCPAMGSGKGDVITPVAPLKALRGFWLFLVHPGFGISTPWAYRQLANFPEALNGAPGRAQQLVTNLASGDLEAASRNFYNSLEAPALTKYPILQLYQRFLRESGAAVAMMSGSGSTTFALFASENGARSAVEAFRAHFGESAWMELTALEIIDKSAA